jgi:hypothetical protein
MANLSIKCSILKKAQWTNNGQGEEKQWTIALELVQVLDSGLYEVKNR